MLSQFRVKYLQQMGELRQLSFIPADTFQRTLPRVRSRGRKSLENVSVKREVPEVSDVNYLEKKEKKFSAVLYLKLYYI